MVRKFSAQHLTGATGLLLFLVCLVYFLEQVDTSLIYFWQQTIALPFPEYVRYPGGISDLIAIYFIELLSSPGGGVVAILILTGILFFSLDLVFRKFQKEPFYYVILIAGLIPYVILFSCYRLPAGKIISLSVALIISALITRYEPGNRIMAAVLHFISGILVYMVAGSGGLIILVVVLIIMNLISANYTFLPTFIILFAIPLLYLPFNTAYRLKEAYLNSFMISRYDEMPLLFYISLFSTVIIYLVFTGLKWIKGNRTPRRPSLLQVTGMTVVLLVFFFSSRAAVNEPDRKLYRMAEAGLEKDWDTILELTEGEYYINKLFQFEVNRALYGKGKLLENLFLVPQPYAEKSIFLEENAASHVAIHLSDFYYDLGYATEARHWANEAQVTFMRHPVVLKHLVMTYLAFGDTAAAGKYLIILSKSRLYRDWAEKIQKMIDENNYKENSDIQSFLINDPKVDFFASTRQPTAKLMTFYSTNPDNNMAFEFLAASYLLQHQIGNLMLLLPEFRRFGYERLPRTVEEAIMIYLVNAKDQKVSLAGYGISKTTQDNFREFNRLLAGSSERSVRIQKVSAFEKTYWYYILFSSPYAQK